MTEFNIVLSCLSLAQHAPIRRGVGIQDGQSQRLRRHHPDHAHFQQPESDGRGLLASPHLRVGRLPRHGAHQDQRGPGGAPGTPAQDGARSQEDQGGERDLPSAGGALPPAGLRERPVRHFHCQRGQDLQVLYCGGGFRVGLWFFVSTLMGTHWGRSYGLSRMHFTEVRWMYLTTAVSGVVGCSVTSERM